MEEEIEVLLIEDNRADAHLIYLYLKEAYSGALSFSSADYLAKGLDLLAKKDFDVIIIDLSLPDSSGIDTFKDVYAAASEKPIIVLTGLEDEEVGINTVKLGAQDFLIKGKLSSSTLKRSVDYSIERYKLLKSLSENTKMLEEKTIDLLKEKIKLAEAQKLAHIGSWEWSVQDNGFTCSEELYHILGLTPGKSDLTYQKLLKLIHPEDREDAIACIEESLKKLQPFDFYCRIKRPDESIRVLHSRGELLLDKEGKVQKILGIKQDVTERKKEEELEQLAMVATKSYNAVTIADKEGKIVWVNQGFTKLFGFTLEDVKGTYGEILRRGEKTGLSPETDFYKMVLAEKKPLSYENRNYSKDGKEYWVLTSLSPILNEKGEVEKIITIDSDISKQKKAEQELIIANKISEHSLYKGNKALEELHKAKLQLEESLKVKEQFLANMSHEIRTPMNAIIGFTNLLLKSQNVTENKQYLNAIKTSGENLLVIINDILDFTKLESGKITFESIRFNLSQLVSLVIELMLPKAVEKKIKLSGDIDKNIPEYLIGDPTRLNQILINLVGNAIKFTNRGQVEIVVSLIRETAGNVELEFAVIDTGIGIPEDSLPKIFESFTQAANDTTRKYGGTGLGLTITKQLVEQQDGKISVISKIGKGSRFGFCLSFEKSAGDDKGPLSEAIETGFGKFPLEGVRVLLVEDNSFNQILACKILDNWKCGVSVAANGIIAVEKVEKEEFDVILMDIQLPEMDGYEATQQIREKMPEPKCHIPIIAMTAHAFSDEQAKCLNAGMNDYISKPFDENKLFEKILKVISRDKKQGADNNRLTERAEEDRLTNLSYIRQISHGDQKFVARMISVFLRQTPGLIEDLKNEFKDKDKSSFLITIHKMKPSVSFMGIKELDEIIQTIEEYISGELFMSQIPDLLKKIQQICEKATKELEIEKKKLEEII
ncbi:MAG TPA: response regulator [Bacteroidia bacterium]|nr:response regulator [Bacteroidia bacterium]